MKNFKRSFGLIMLVLMIMGSASLFAKPVKLSIIDVAGNLQLTQAAINAFKDAHPELVSEIETIKAAPRAAGETQSSGRCEECHHKR